MGKTTGIEWTDSTWNPIRGCSRVSEGCRNCYAESIAARFSGIGRPYRGLASFKIIGKGTPGERLEPHWTGEVRFIEEHLEDPLHWKEPKKIFVNSMSDLFHPGVKDEWLVAITDVMARAPQHTYQILTKRPDRMRTFLEVGLSCAADFERTFSQRWPPPNWWFGVSVENEETAEYRIPILAECPAPVRFVSYEPALGPISFANIAMKINKDNRFITPPFEWLICGGESGPHARPMHPDWAKSARDYCYAVGIPFFFKQWGEFSPEGPVKSRQCAVAYKTGRTVEPVILDKFPFGDGSDGGWQVMYHVGKHNAGSNLDGVEWKEFPK